MNFLYREDLITLAILIKIFSFRDAWWLSWLSGWFLISAQTMISGSWDQIPASGSTLSGESARGSLSLCPFLSLTLSLKEINYFLQDILM